MSADKNEGAEDLIRTLLQGMALTSEIIKVLTEREDEISDAVHDELIPLIEGTNAVSEKMVRLCGGEIFRRELEAGWPPEGGPE